MQQKLLTKRSASLIFTLAMIATACVPAQPAAQPAAKVAEATTAVEATKAPEATTAPEPTKAPSFQIANLKDVPREKTLVLTPWYNGNQLNGYENWNVLANTGAMRDLGGNKGVFEGLMYTNLNTGEITPWLAESFEVNAEFTKYTVKLRSGVKWADDKAFTCKDVKYTLELLRDRAPEYSNSSYMKEWLKDVTCNGDLIAEINLNKPNARFFREKLAAGHENHIPIVPEHIWSQQKVITEFTNLDMDKGFPIGTGPYKLVSASAQQIILDRRDTWWGAETGFKKMPAPERIIMTVAASDEALGEAYITNKIDYGNALQVGTYQAAVAKNPALRPWFKDGPVYGAGDGCNYVLIFNNAKEPFSNKSVRLATNYAIDRSKIVELGYLGATRPNVAPFSNYLSAAWLKGDFVQVIQSFGRDKTDPGLVDKYMEEAGYTKNADTKWEKEGKPIQIKIRTPDWLAPIGPIVTEQLLQAGFTAEEAPDRTGAWANELLAGQFDATVMVHCNSLYDPFNTLQDYHSKNATDIGTPSANIFGSHRYKNPELDKILNDMEKLPGVNTDTDYINLVEKATKIYLDDLPELVLAEELHVIPANETYWKGWPNSADPYVAPFPCWDDIYLAMFKLQPAK